MPSATAKLGLLSTVCAIVWLVLPGTANADTQTRAVFDGIVRPHLPEPSMPAPAIGTRHGGTSSADAQLRVDLVRTTACSTIERDTTELADATLRDASIDSLVLLLAEI